MSSKNRRKDCEHCKEYLTLLVHKRHKSKYYDEKKRKIRGQLPAQNPPVYYPSIDAEDHRIISLSKYIW